MRQAVEDLVFEDDYQHKKSRQPTFQEECVAYVGRMQKLYRGRWRWVIIGVSAAPIAWWLFLALPEFVPYFNSGL